MTEPQRAKPRAEGGRIFTNGHVYTLIICITIVVVAIINNFGGK